ncbi:MAG: DUF6577 family protein [Chitinophagales bacterium]
MEENKFIQHFKNYGIFTNKDAHEFYHTSEKNLSRNAVNSRIYKLIEKDVINRVGRGQFKVGASKKYESRISKKALSIGRHLKKHFPLLDFCVWNSTIVKEFSLHQSVDNFIIVETERDALKAVFYHLKEKYKQVYLKPSREMIENHLLEMKEVIIVQHLVSEAPLQKKEGVSTTTIEKLLVDLVCGKKVFYFYQGYELKNIFRQAFDKYTINKSTLFRYANRRKKKQEIVQLLKSINRH